MVIFLVWWLSGVVWFEKFYGSAVVNNQIQVTSERGRAERLCEESSPLD